MFPIDVTAEVEVLGRAPLKVREFEETRSAEGAPPITLSGLFLLPTENAQVRPFVEARAGVWHAEYDTALAYDASVVRLDGDLGFRMLPLAPPTSEGAWAVLPFFDAAIGLRTWSVLHPWWDDETLLGSAVALGAGFSLGDSKRHFLLRAHYEAAVGPAVRGVLDSALSDLHWTFDPVGGRLGIALGYGWR